MMRLPTMTTAIYRLRPRQMLKMIKGIFAVIVRIEFGYSSDSWFKAQIRFMKNSRLSSWGESLNFTVCTFHRARSGSTDDKLSQRFMRYTTAQITTIYRDGYSGNTKNAEPSFSFICPGSIRCLCRWKFVLIFTAQKLSSFPQKCFVRRQDFFCTFMSLYKFKLASVGLTKISILAKWNWGEIFSCIININDLHHRYSKSDIYSTEVLKR